MKVKIIFLCTLLIIALSCTMVSAKQNNPPSSLEEAKSMANNELGFEYFKQENINGKPIDWVIVNGLSNVDLGGQRYGALVYGESHGDNVNGSPRFLGYTKNDEDYTNPAHPHDAWGGGYLEERNWIEQPWNSSSIRTKYNIAPNDFDDNAKYLPNIQKGIAVYYADVSRGGDSPYWYKWEKYIHIMMPPTEYGWGMGRMWHNTGGSTWYISIPLAPGCLINKEVPNLKVNAFSTGVEGKAYVGKAYTAWVDYMNDSKTTSVTAAPVGATNNGYPAKMLDEGGNQVDSITLLPGEIKTMHFVWHASDSSHALKAYIDTPPLPDLYKETTEEDNKAFKYVATWNEDTGSIGGDLRLQATSKGGYDAYGVYHQTIKRLAYTAKWTDNINASLTIKQPIPPQGELIEWYISSAKLTYPRVASNFAFGSPYPPQGSVNVNMSTGYPGLSDYQTTQVNFEENWAMDGFNNGEGIYNMLEDRVMAAQPKRYLITANYSVTYTYEYIVCDKDGCWKERRTVTVPGSASANLLVNGIGSSVRSN